MIPLRDDVVATRPPVVSLTLIAVFIAVFLLQLATGDLPGVIRAWGFVPRDFFAALAGGPPPGGPAGFGAVLVYAFLHGSWVHLAGNLLFTWIFADNVEDAMGHAAFVVFFALCAIAAALAHAALYPASASPIVGASGGVSGVLGAYLLMYPRARIHTAALIFIVVQIVRFPAWVVLLFWFFIQILFAVLAPGYGGGIAFAAHMGGFVAGIVLAPVFAAPLRARLGALLRGRQGDDAAAA